MKNVEIPDDAAVTVMTPLQMNGVHFDKKHTVLTPELLKNVEKKKNAATDA